MNKKELKEKIEQIMKNKAFIGTVGDILEEIDFEDVANEIVNLLPIHDVSCCSKEELQKEYDRGFFDGCEHARPAY